MGVIGNKSPGRLRLKRYTGDGNKQQQKAFNDVNANIELNRIVRPPAGWVQSAYGWIAPTREGGRSVNLPFKVVAAKTSGGNAAVKVEKYSALYETPDAQDTFDIDQLGEIIEVSEAGSVYLEVDVDLVAGVYEISAAEIKTGKWTDWPAAAAFDGSGVQTFAYREIAEVVEKNEANATAWEDWETLTVGPADGDQYIVRQMLYSHLITNRSAYADKAAVLLYPYS